MFGRIFFAALIYAAAWASSGTPAAAAPSESDRALIAAVASQVCAEADPPEGLRWPPLVAVSANAEIGVYAVLFDAGDGQPRVVLDGGQLEWIELDATDQAPAGAELQPVVVVTQGMLDAIIEGRSERLAAALGHAAAHVLLGHAEAAPRGKPLTADMITPQQETEADVLGLKLALAADFPYRRAVAFYLAMRDHASGASFEGTNAGHPSWEDRLAALDERQAELLRSITAFEAGVHFLMIEHYTLAEQCFDQVTKEFPKAYEAWANLGYARLMLYCDALEMENMRRYDVGQLVVGGFYLRPESLSGITRGILEDIWYDAVGALRQALILNPDLLLPKASLSVAYLLHPDGKDVARAASFAMQVVPALDAGGGEAMDPSARGALLVNVGVAMMEVGDAESAARLFDEAWTLAEAGQACGARTALASAIRHNRGRLRAASGDPAERQAALADFEAALAGCHPTATWRTLAYERYVALCDELGEQPRSQDELYADQPDAHGVVAGLALNGAPIVALGDSIEAAEAALGDHRSAGQLRDVHKKTNIRQLAYDVLGAELLCAGRVIAIRLHAATGAAITVTAADDGEPRMLRIGMSLNELEAALGVDASHWEERAGVEQQSEFRFYACLGLGVRVNGSEVAEIIVAQPPR
jgi:tetratricopeptide (TPR) repeat protein